MDRSVLRVIQRVLFKFRFSIYFVSACFQFCFSLPGNIRRQCQLFVLHISNWLHIEIVHDNLFWSRIPTIDCLILHKFLYKSDGTHVRLSPLRAVPVAVEFDWLDFRGMKYTTVGVYN